VDLETVTAEITQVLITKEQIETRIQELAKEIDAHYGNKDV
jgi:hypoxanthine-guanine phosphoribosyltransferase